MHKNITARIIEYLQLDTSYAIILNGNYGVGKTHYIKNELFPEIKELEEKDDSTKYTPVLVSLFGTKTIEDIQDRIFLALYPKLNMKGLKIFASLLNAGIKFLNNDGKKILKEAGVTSGSMTDYSKILICIDDIDRKSTALDLAEVLGFVNNLVENANAKVLLISNEDKLRSELEAKEAKADDYSLLKEKVIGVTMNFSADTSNVIDEIIKSKYEKEEKSYFDFLFKHRKVIKEKISKNDGNLRNLMFFLEHFKIIYIKSEKLLSEDKKSNEIKNGVLEGILNLALPVSIEYKMGKLHDGNFEEIRQLYRNPHGWIEDIEISSDIEEEESAESEFDYPEEYRKKYLFGVKYNVQNIYYESVFDNLVGLTIFDIEEFKEELSLTDWYKENEIHERDKLIEKLSQWYFIDLSLKEYRTLVNKVLSYVDKGEYALNEYVYIFYLVNRYKILDYDFDVLKDRFIKGINKGKSIFNSVPYPHSLVRNVDYGKSQMIEIEKYCMEINEDIRKKELRGEKETLFQIFQTDLPKFIEEATNQKSKFFPLIILSEFSFNKTWMVFKRAKNSEIIEFGHHLTHEYSRFSFFKQSPLKEFLEKLKAQLDTEVNKPRTKKMTKVAYEILSENIDTALKKPKS